jgi:hypothetical protein
MSSPLQLRPRTIPEIVDAAVPLLRQHYLLLVTASTVILAPGFLLRIALPTEALWISNMLNRLLFVMVNGATISIVSESYLGGVPDLASTLRAVGARSASLLGASILRGLLIALGLVVLIVPGVVFYAWSFAMPMAVMIEGRPAGEAYARSSALVRGHTGRVLLAMLLGFIVMMLLVFAIGVTAARLAGAAGLPMRTIDLLGQLAMIFAYPIGGVVATLLYYDLRIRNEGFDLEVMARELAA